MDLNKLVKTTEKSKKRVGRGTGSGKGGHTVGRGQKGQKTRGKIPLVFQGSKARKTLFHRLPLMRGKGKFKARSGKPIIVNLKYLNIFKENEIVNAESLVKKGILKRDDLNVGVKILGEGSLAIPLIVQILTSKGARVKIEKAGGKVEILKPQSNQTKKTARPSKQTVLKKAKKI